MNSSPQHSFFANNVKIFFPFEPYPVQKEYMTSVVEALNNRQNAILESPTGTGKTLSLLCSTMAWLSQTGNKSTIYYTSRTHQQLGQAAKEMKKTAYARQPAVVIGSRVHMCLNKDVKNQHNDNLINRSCRNAIAKNACSYYSNYEQKLEQMDHNNIHDIEDLEKFGQKHQCCPYYASRKVAELKANLIFMPYNYLFDISIRRSIQLKLENSVVIIDEAHNIEGVLKDAASGLFTSNCLKLIIENCEKLPEAISKALNSELHGLSRYGYDPKKKLSKVVDEFNEKQNGKAEKEKKPNPIEELAEKLTNDKLQQIKRCCVVLQEKNFKDQLQKTTNTDKLLDIMKEAAIDYTTSDTIVTTLDSMASFWSIAGVMKPEMVARYVTALSSFSHFISLLYPEACISLGRQQDHVKRLKKFYVYRFDGIYDESDRSSDPKLIGWELKLWCLHPAIGLKRVLDASCINGPRSIILTSGTLAPMHSIGLELETDFKIIKAFKHVISESQFKVAIIGSSPSQYNLSSAFKDLIDKYFEELGKTLLPILRILPHGTLVFFPSYGAMDKVMNYWERKSTIWRDIQKTSRVFREKPKQEQNEFDSDLKSYKLETKTRAIFFVVCRGKLSEGANLQGNECRTVIITGLPFPARLDPKVDANVQYQKQKSGGMLNIWYSQQMLRALNQTIGRVIRSKSDFGLLLLCSPTFREYRMSVSEWVRSFYPTQSTPFNELEKLIKDFFAVNSITISDSVSDDLGAFEVNLSNHKSFNPRELSPFSEDSNKSSQGSQEQVCAAQKRQNAMLEQYRVDRATYDKVKQARCATIEETEEVKSKRARTTSEIFESIYSSTTTNESFNSTNSSSQIQTQSEHQSQVQSLFSTQTQPRNQSQTQNQSQSQTQTQSSCYSTLNQLRDKDRPANYKCYICSNSAINPYRTNCSCAKVACHKCIKVLHKTVCGKCGTMQVKRNFKQVLFKSAFFAHERQKVFTIPSKENS